VKLSDAAVKKAKPEAKAYKMTDGGGMYLEVMRRDQNIGGSNIVLAAKRSDWPSAYIQM
jgi:hypothetical protein